MQIFIDTEFTDFGANGELISVGLTAIAPGTPSLYLEVADFDQRKCSDFVRAHVLPLLEGRAKTKDFHDVALAVWDWLAQLGATEPLQLVIDYDGDAQWLNGLLTYAHQQGRPSVLPPGLLPKPLHLMSVIDLASFGSWEALCDQFTEQFGLRVHHALDDAVRNRLIYEFAPHR